MKNRWLIIDRSRVSVNPHVSEKRTIVSMEKAMYRQFVIVLLTTIFLNLVSCQSPINSQSSIITTSDSDKTSPITENIPVADPGTNLLVRVGETAILDGSNSNDPEGNSLTYRWTILSTPSSSSSSLIDSSTVNPSLTPDTTGDYLIQLIVNDGVADSSADYVLITSITGVPTASRTTGVAPLSVFFNAGFSGDGSFHDVEYSWDFGDPGSGNWAITESSTGSSKNFDKGPVAAHVFENAGDYTVTVSSKNASGDTTSDILIHVDEPNSIYAGTSTTCISDVTPDDFDECPDGANHVFSTDITTIKEYFGNNKRILLKRDGYWSSSESVATATGTNVTIGAYGPCPSRDAREICSNAPRVDLSSQGKAHFLDVGGTDDWRVQDIRFTGTSGTDADNKILSGNIDTKNFLALRINSTYFHTHFSIGMYITNGHDQVSIVDCDLSDSQKNGIWIGSERLIIMGTRIQNVELEHGIRVWQSYLGVISHNVITGASKHVLKFHGPREEYISLVAESKLDHRSEYSIVADNIFGTSGSYAVRLGPQNTNAEERISNIIIEKNRFFVGYGIAQSELVTNSLALSASKISIRNNVFDGTGSSSYWGAILIGQSPVLPMYKSVRVFNNTIYKTDYLGGNEGYSGIYISNGFPEISVINNLAQLPTEGANAMLQCINNCDYVESSHNLLTDDNPGFVDSTADDFLLRDFNLKSDSAAINNGKTISVMDDFQGNERPNDATYDVGAFEFY